MIYKDIQAIGKVFNGKTPSKAQQRNSGLPILKIRDIDENGKFKGAFESFVDSAFYEKYSNKVVKENDTIILNAAHNSDYVGNKSALVSEDLEGVIATGEWLIIRIFNANASYVNHFLRSSLGKKKLKSCVKGIHLYPKDVERIKIPFPTDSGDQKRIASLLGKVESLIHERKQSLEQLDELLKSVFLDMFGDPKLNPKKYPVRKLSEFYIDPKTGTKCGPFGSALKKDEFVDSGIPVWNMDNIDPKGKPVMPLRMWITEEKYENLSAYEVYKGDILISRAGTVGKMCVSEVEAPSIISTNLIRLRLNPEKLNPIHFVSLMTYCASRVGRLKVGADGALTHMNTGILDTLELPYPPPDLQKQFALIVDKAQKIKSRLSSALSDLEILYNALSQKAFKGELDLSGIKLQDEEVELSSFDRLQQSIDTVNSLIPEPVRRITETVNKIIPPSIRSFGPFSHLDLFGFNDPKARQQILEHWFNEWLEDSQADELKLYRFWARAQRSLVDYLYEEDLEEYQFTVEDYDAVKKLVFQAIDNGLIEQGTNIRIIKREDEKEEKIAKEVMYTSLVTLGQDK